MNVRRARLHSKAVVACGLTALALFVGPFGPKPTFAHNGFCYDDPIVLLSNGVTVDMSATISDSASDVRAVQYALHVPATVARIVSISYSTQLTSNDTFTL